MEQCGSLSSRASPQHCFKALNINFASNVPLVLLPFLSISVSCFWDRTGTDRIKKPAISFRSAARPGCLEKVKEEAWSLSNGLAVKQHSEEWQHQRTEEHQMLMLCLDSHRVTSIITFPTRRLILLLVPGCMSVRLYITGVCRYYYKCSPGNNSRTKREKKNSCNLFSSLTWVRK